MAHVGKTEQLTLRARREFVESLKNISRDTVGGTHNQLALLLVEEGLSLLQNPDSCPPFSPEFVRLRAKLHGTSGSYVDEPGRVPAGQTVAGNLAQNDLLFRLMDEVTTLKAQALARDKASPPGFRKGHHEEQSGGGAMAV